MSRRRGPAAAPLRFAIGRCVLGALLVARGERGLCAILLGDDAQALLAELWRCFGAVEVLVEDAGLEPWLAQVAAFVAAPQGALDVPLELGGTPFQRRVWQALGEIPPGTTLGYAELAARIGAPRAARAVAAACAANRLAVAIPCHRVLRSDGQLSGYRWGVARKRALLECEARR